MHSVEQWTRFEAAFECAGDYENPTLDLQVHADITHESGATRAIEGFWDGGATWRVRFMPVLLGRYRWRLRSGDSGLNGQEGEFACVPYTGSNTLYRHGAVGVAPAGHHFAHADGTPFFWLGDTVWNGPLKAPMNDWTYFLADRSGKGFNVVQFVTTQWVAAAGNADLRMAFVAGESIRIDPAFYRWLDARVDAINDFGMVANPVLIWSAPSKKWALPLNPGTALPDDQLTVLARYLVARYGAHHVFWALAGDGDYRGGMAERWKRMGRTVFDDHAQPVTMHPMGQIWVGDDFEAETWFHFHGYQSSHWHNEKALRWVTEGPPSHQWKNRKPRPVVNMEPCYEAHLDMSEPKRSGRHAFDELDVRRLSYWSLLVSPSAGVTYGAHGVWGWEVTRQLPMNHALTGIAPTWREGMALPGSASMKVLKQIFQSIRWWDLLPAPELVAVQPGRESAEAFIAAAVSKNGDLGIVYAPAGGEIKLKTDLLKTSLHAEWIDPSNGDRITGAKPPYIAPGPGDWVLLFREHS